MRLGSAAACATLVSELQMSDEIAILSQILMVGAPRERTVVDHACLEISTKIARTQWW
jgi:hypothetical protein